MAILEKCLRILRSTSFLTGFLIVLVIAWIAAVIVQILLNPLTFDRGAPNLEELRGKVELAITSKNRELLVSSFSSESDVGKDFARNYFDKAGRLSARVIGVSAVANRPTPTLVVRFREGNGQTLCTAWDVVDEPGGVALDDIPAIAPPSCYTPTRS